MHTANTHWIRNFFISITALCLITSHASVSAQEKPVIKYAEVDGVKLAYYTRGQGEPLLMINGFMSTMSLWDPALLDELSKNNQLVLFDNRGVGLSTDTQKNLTTIPQMADDAAGLAKALGYKKINILAWSMGARIGQQLLIRHPDLVGKAVLCAANPGGRHQIPASQDVESKLNNPNIPEMEKIGLVFTNNEAGRNAASEILSRLKSAVAAGTIPNDFTVSKETTTRQDRARTTLWKSNQDNFVQLKHIKAPVLVTDGRNDVIDIPKNSEIIANQIPYAWLAYFEGGHAFLFQDYKKFADTVNVFLK